jgi:AcrR family transcriptional regulator
MTSHDTGDLGNPPPGRREAKKEATRTAVRTAAKQLFAERGYEATTVRDIAHAANVTERTFYRYFDGKEGLIAEETLAWIEILHDTIRDRPADEPPLVAAKEAMIEVARHARSGIGPAPVWLFSDQPRPFALVRRTSPRLLVRFERAVADALLTRAASFSPPATESAVAEFHAAILGRVAVATLRSVAIHQRALRDPGTTAIEPALHEAFAILAEEANPWLVTRARRSRGAERDRG